MKMKFSVAQFTFSGKDSEVFIFTLYSNNQSGVKQRISQFFSHIIIVECRSKKFLKQFIFVRFSNNQVKQFWKMCKSQHGGACRVLHSHSSFNALIVCLDQGGLKFA